ncbi:MAG: hypothetical protein HRT53_16470 [Colwellia sp.]|nr:hypothetical protein [Colwellia sp.]
MKKNLVSIFIISLLVAGLLGGYVLLSGKFDDIKMRILFSTLAFTVYSIIGICCNSIIGGEYKLVGVIGLASAVFGLIYALITTWFTPELSGFLQIRFSLLFIAMCFAHISLMLLIDKTNSMVSGTIFISIACSVFATVIAVSMLSSLSATLGSLKLLGIVSIVGVISTIIAPTVACTANKQFNKD